MIASLIAYGVTLIFALLGSASIWQLITKDMDQSRTLATFGVGMAFFPMAWGCAYLGGI